MHAWYQNHLLLSYVAMTTTPLAAPTINIRQMEIVKYNNTQ